MFPCKIQLSNMLQPEARTRGVIVGAHLDEPCPMWRCLEESSLQTGCERNLIEGLFVGLVIQDGNIWFKLSWAEESLPLQVLRAWGVLPFYKYLSYSCPDHNKPSVWLWLVKLLRIMLRNRCWLIVFYIITTEDGDKGCM